MTRANIWRSRIVGHDLVDPRHLIGNPKNHRTHPQRQRDAVRDSISELGFVRSVTVNKTTGFVVDGHERLWQALEAVETNPDVKIDVEYVELTPEEESKALAVLDATTDLAEVDPVKLDELLRDFETSSEALAGMLSDLAESAGILDEQNEVEDVEPEIDRADELQKEWGTEEGQLWIIEGKQTHRLLCGDSTKADDVGRLMGGEKAGLMVTDPPYGVEYDANRRFVVGRQQVKGGAVGKVENDDRSDWREAWTLFSGDVAYVFHADVNSPTVADSLESVGLIPRCLIVWAKSSMVPLPYGINPAQVEKLGLYHHKDEPCWYAFRHDASVGWVGPKNETTLWEIDKPTKSETGHSTQKPIECMARPIRNHKADIVYDPFLGSGTTMLAAEQLNRKCYGMEISPKYCAVILQRMKSAGCECRLEETNGQGKKTEDTRGTSAKRELCKKPKPENKNTPTPKRKRPIKPDTIKADPVASKKWNQLCKEMEEMGIIARCDIDLMEVYCVLFSQYRQALAKVRTTGLVLVTREKGGKSIEVKRNPFETVQYKAIAQLTKLMSEMGLTPTARERLAASPQEENDPFLEFLNLSRGSKN